MKNQKAKTRAKKHNIKIYNKETNRKEGAFQKNRQAAEKNADMEVSEKGLI